MAGFIGGSAWKMAQDISEGFVSVNLSNLKKFQLPDLRLLVFELEKRQRGLRKSQSAVDELLVVKARNRRLLRLSQSLTMIRSFAKQRFKTIL